MNETATECARCGCSKNAHGGGRTGCVIHRGGESDCTAFVMSSTDAEEFYRRIIGRRYWFAGAAYASEGSGLAPVYLVAMRSAEGESWAAYIAGVGLYDVEDDALAVKVAGWGAKIDERTARALFPDIPEAYRA